MISVNVVVNQAQTVQLDFLWSSFKAEAHELCNHAVRPVSHLRPPQKRQYRSFIGINSL